MMRAEKLICQVLEGQDPVDLIEGIAAVIDQRYAGQYPYVPTVKAENYPLATALCAPQGSHETEANPDSHELETQAAMSTGALRQVNKTDYQE